MAGMTSNEVESPEDRIWFGGVNIWHHSAPRSIAQHCEPGRDGKGWSAWQSHLSCRNGPIPVDELVSSPSWPLLWNLPEQFRHGDGGLMGPLGRIAQQKTAKGWNEQVESWLFESAGAKTTLQFGIECVAMGYTLPAQSRRLDARLWWQVLDQLVQVASDDSHVNLYADPPMSQLVAGELPLVLAYQFPEIAPCRSLKRASHTALSEGIVELLDGEGMPHGDLLPRLPALLACWTRCVLMGTQMKKHCWSDDAQVQYEWLIRQALRLSRSDGGLLLSPIGDSHRARELWHAALEFGDAADEAAARDALPALRSTLKKRTRAKEPPEPDYLSEWAEAAVLRSEWSSARERLALSYGHRRIELEFVCGTETLFSGVWALDVSTDGNALSPAGTWEEVCWFTDKDVEYLELEIELQRAWKANRQILLSRSDRFLYLSDTIVAPESAPIEYRGTLPLTVQWKPEAETREGTLVGKKPLSRLLPLALPEWRDGSRYGTLEADPAGLQLEQRITGKSLYCPLFFDLHPRRIHKAVTWRQLTVAQNLEVQPRDVAVGYRVQCGPRQWLIYRSLAERASRTLLGQNVACECLVARFLRSGEVEELLQVE